MYAIRSYYAQIVAANKCDMAEPEKIQEFKEYIEAQGFKFFPISAATTQGTKELIYEVAAQLEALPPIKKFEIEPLTQQELDEKFV